MDQRGLLLVEDPFQACRLLDQVRDPCTRDGRRYRALNLLSNSNRALFSAVLRGEHFIHGFRNQDLVTVSAACEAARMQLSSENATGRGPWGRVPGHLPGKAGRPQTLATGALTSAPAIGPAVTTRPTRALSTAPFQNMPISVFCLRRHPSGATRHVEIR